MREIIPPMTDNILLRFLKTGLIDVGGDDAKLSKLTETAADLAATLKKAPAKAASFALIAFDPDASQDDPVIIEAMAALHKRWATCVNTFNGTPVAVLRAVLLDALVQAARSDDKVGVAFAYSARNALPFMEAGNESPIWADALAEIEERIDTRAQEEWATPESISVPALTFAAPKPIVVSTASKPINKAALTKGFEAAAGPNNANNQETKGNRYWPHGNPHAWVTDFGARMTDVISQALEENTAGSKIAPIDLSGPLNELSQAVAEHVAKTLKAVSEATAGLQRRTNLIWWKEALYSPSARTSYRSHPHSIAAGLMAFDLHRQVPTFSPASISAFLEEAVLILPSLDAAQTRPISDFLSEALASPSLLPLRESAAQLAPEPQGRGPLLAILGHSSTAAKAADAVTFRALVGVPATTPLTVSGWAQWLFRELQAARAAHEGTGSPKPARKSR
jgi:cell pole-organizing protein PopZ